MHLVRLLKRNNRKPKKEPSMNTFLTLIDPTSLAANPLVLVALVFTGATIGVIGGLFGVSGCFLLTPVLAEIFGMDYTYAAGMASCHAVGIAATGLRRHTRVGSVDIRLGLTIAVGAAMGAIIGSKLLDLLKVIVFAGNSDDLDFTVRIIYLVLLVFVTTLFVKPAKAGDSSILQKLQLGFRWQVPGEPEKTFSGPGTIIAAFLCGIACGFLGIGGGVLYLPLLVIAVGAKAQNAIRVSLLIVLCSAIGATIGHAWADHVSLTGAMMMIIGSSIGVQGGALICQKLHTEKLKRYFIFVLLSTMGLIIWKLIHP